LNWFKPRTNIGTTTVEVINWLWNQGNIDVTEIHIRTFRDLCKIGKNAVDEIIKYLLKINAPCSHINEYMSSHLLLCAFQHGYRPKNSDMMYSYDVQYTEYKTMVKQQVRNVATHDGPITIFDIKGLTDLMIMYL
jgi:hypothetical protein